MRKWVTMFCGIWLVAGFIIDGEAHLHGLVESFWTPWHAILYTGFLVTSLVFFTLYKIEGHIPPGYGFGFVGVSIFFIGGIGDMLWHLIFGVEKDTAALLSPTHLVLMTRCFLILSCPLREAMIILEQKPSLKSFVPALISLTLSTSIVAFFLMYAFAFGLDEPKKATVELFESHFVHHVSHEFESSQGD